MAEHPAGRTAHRAGTARRTGSRRAGPGAGAVAGGRIRWAAAAIACAALLGLPTPAAAAVPADGEAAAPRLEPCWLRGLAGAARCGRLERAEDPDRPAGRRIELRFAVVPALATRSLPDPVFVLAGGPGQSAQALAGTMSAVLAPLNTRRDLVFVDVRGTGASAALGCPRDPALAVSVDASAETRRLERCLLQLAQRADLRQYATWIAVEDLDAVRATLGYAEVNLWAASYGTRVALEWMRRFPGRIRSAVLDGVAPPDLGLPATLAVDADAALSRLVAACGQDPACRRDHPRIAAELEGWLAAGPPGRRFVAADPLTGTPRELRVDGDALAALLRTPLYVPALAAVLPHALGRALAGELAPLLALSAATGSGLGEDLAEGLHFAVVCAEDLPRIDAAAREAAARTRFGTRFVELYARVCAQVPTRPVPEGFRTVAAVDVPVLVLSGGADPATPPRHGERVAAALGRARHLVAPHLAHGVTPHGCATDLVVRFVRSAHLDDIDGECLQRLPAPTLFVAPGPAP